VRGRYGQAAAFRDILTFSSVPVDRVTGFGLTGGPISGEEGRKRSATRSDFGKDTPDTKNCARSIRDGGGGGDAGWSLIRTGVWT